MGIAKSTLPDVCKTPSPGGPVPIPYPVIVSMSSDLKKGTKTVKVDGKKMAAVKGSEFSRCMGDEPGTAGGVKSSTNMKEATWLLYSFDVKLDGKNACRLSDKMMMNHGNTVCLSGEQQIPVPGATKYPNQTCPDSELEAIQEEKKQAKIELGGRGGKSSSDAKLAKSIADTGSSKKIQRYVKKHGCVHLKKRRDNLKKLLEIRVRERDNCFKSGPIHDDPESMEAYGVHQDQIRGTEEAIKKLDGIISNYC
jgi:hypothetical protein